MIMIRLTLLINHLYFSQILSLSAYFFPLESGENTQRFGCETEGCSVSETWLTAGVCIDPKISLTIFQTDFDESNETASIRINDEYLGDCVELNETCTNDWRDCEVVNEYYANTLVLRNATQIAVAIDLSSEVNVCPHKINGSRYFLWSQVTIECISVSVIEQYRWNISSETKLNPQLGCNTTGCSLVAIGEIVGANKSPIIMVSIAIETIAIETTSSIAINDNEIPVDIYINNHNVGYCKFNDLHHSDGWFNCSNVDEYLIFDYLDNFSTDDHETTNNYVEVYLNGTAMRNYSDIKTSLMMQYISIDYHATLSCIIYKLSLTIYTYTVYPR